MNVVDILLKEAQGAIDRSEIPVAALIVYKDKIVAKAHNTRQNNCDVLGHAEITVIKKAQKKLKDWRLDDCEMYVTLKPCKMCIEVIKASRIKKVFFLIDNQKQITTELKISEIISNDIDAPKVEKYRKNLQKFFTDLRK